MEKSMAPHSNTLAWKIPWTEEPGRLQSIGSPRVGHNWATSLSLFTFMHWRRKGQPTPVFLPGESQGQGSLVGCHLWDHTVGHNWSDLAAAVCICYSQISNLSFLAFSFNQDSLPGYEQCNGHECLEASTFFWPCHMACGILVPRPGIEPAPPAMWLPW